MTFQIITKLFEKSETRGEDASGYWGVDKDSGNVLYYKEPSKSSVFVKTENWNLVSYYNPVILIAHSRGASKGVGEPSVNHNNHPFTSLDKSVGLIHNGRIDDSEYNSLKQKYSLNTQCDSELLLRIFEAGEKHSFEKLKKFSSSEYPHRLAGVQDIFSLINEGHMAVAIGERLEEDRVLWLFRNRHRPLWIVDVRESLGQVFFVSDPNFWNDSLEELYRSNSDCKNIFKTQKLIELPTEEIWIFKTNEKTHSPDLRRFSVVKEGTIPWKFDGKKIELINKKSNFDVISSLDEDLFDEENYDHKDFDKKKAIKLLAEKCDEIRNSLDSFKFFVEEQIECQNINNKDFEEIMIDLEQQKEFLEQLDRHDRFWN